MNLSKTDLLLRDSTLREGLDTPQVFLTLPQKLEVFKILLSLGVSNFEIVAPGNFEEGLSLLIHLHSFNKVSKSAILPVLLNDKNIRIQKLFDAGANHLDLLLHISDIRLVKSGYDKSPNTLKKIIDLCQSVFENAYDVGFCSIGMGFGDAFRADSKFLSSLITKLSKLKPAFFNLYDSVGIALPLQVADLINKLHRITKIPLHVHFHNDLGMASANTLVALGCGATGADLTIGGLGDRSGNASLEEVITGLGICMGFKTGIDLSKITELSRRVLKIFEFSCFNMKPIIGDYAFAHSTPSHYYTILNGLPEAYEPFPPERVGQKRRFQVNSSPEFLMSLQKWYSGKKNLHEIESFISRYNKQLLTEEQLSEIII